MENKFTYTINLIAFTSYFQKDEADSLFSFYKPSEIEVVSFEGVKVTWAGYHQKENGLWLNLDGKNPKFIENMENQFVQVQGDFWDSVLND